MADIRIKDLPTTATQTASDDFIALDGTVNGTRKIDASAPSFKTSVTSPSIVAPAATALTLTGGSTGASLVLGQGTSANVKTIIPSTNASGIFSFMGGPQTTDGAKIRLALGGYGFIGFENLAPAIVAYQSGVTNFSGLAFETYNGSGRNEVMRLTTTQNLLIGTTTDAASLAGGLVVNGSGAGAAASSTVTGALRVTGGVGVSGSGYFGGAVASAQFASPTGGSSGGVISLTGANANIEMGTAGTTNTPFIDFHSSASSTDYDARIVASGGTASNGAGTLSLTAATINVPGTTSASSSTVGALTIGNGTAATNVAIGAGAIVAGGGITSNGGSAIGVNGFLSGNYYRLIENQADSTNGGGIIQTLLAGTWTNTLTMTHTGNATLRNALTVSGSAASTGVGTGSLQTAGGIYAGAASVFAGNVTVTGTANLGVSPTLVPLSVDFSGGSIGGYARFGPFPAANLDSALILTGSRIASGFGDVFLGRNLIPVPSADTMKTLASTGYNGLIFRGASGATEFVGAGTSTAGAAITPTVLFSLNNTTRAATFAGLIFPQQAVTASAPAYVKGAIYFDTTLNKLRVGGATAWETITSV